jgi:acetoin utilization protein AcuC
MWASCVAFPWRIVPDVATDAGPLLVFGPRSLTYDFGPHHPLTPLRFGPGIDLLRAVGAEPGLDPEPATDEELLRIHRAEYLETVRAFSRDPTRPGEMGIGLSDNPAFAGMHESAASVAGGSLRAMEAILRGDVEHAHHPGGGLHHAMPGRASGFCIYDDPALAVVRARADGFRVLYVDLDVHHGDGVQAMVYADPGTLTVSVHESGRYLFPGTGFADELGHGPAAGTSVNLPFEPFAGEAAWLPAVRALVPSLAAVFGPDVVVSQHGADSHAWDPLAHLRVTTTAMAEAARLVDAVAHRWARGRWLATGGGGYDAYRVVPRTWALTWLAGAHREPPEATPGAWRDRWAADADRFGTPGMPERFLDGRNAGRPVEPAQAAAEDRSLEMLAHVRATVLPRLVREAEDRGWWRPALTWAGRSVVESARPTDASSVARLAAAHRPVAGPSGVPAEIRIVDGAILDRLTLVPRAIPPFDPADGHAILAAALASGGRVVAAVVGDAIVGVAVSAPSGPGARTESLLALGVAPGRRRTGLGHALLRTLLEGLPAGTAFEAHAGVAERDVVEPLDVETRIAVARRLFEGAGLRVRAPAPDLARDDRWAIAAVRDPG